MAGNYAPDDAAPPGLPWNITFLSQRDVGLQVPINFITAPGVSVSAACFAHRVYEDDAAGLCISNLLAIGFRRLIFDIYWDTVRSVWSFCPVELPLSGFETTSVVSHPTQSNTGDTLTTGTPHSTTSVLAASTQSKVLKNRVGISGRQQATNFPSTATSSFNSTIAIHASITSPNATTTVSIVPTPPDPNETLYKSGPYTCSATTDLSLLINILTEYLFSTDTTIKAVLKYIVINLHVAASELDPNAPAKKPSTADLPSESQMIGFQFRDSNLASFIYRPVTLAQQRVDLNTSWYRASNATGPDPAYYNSVLTDNGIATAPDGWPSESYLEFGNFGRLLIAFGTVDPQISDYNFAAESRYVFSNSDISRHANVTTNADGSIRSGCIFNPAHTSLSLANSSWAIFTDTLDLSSYSTTFNLSLSSPAYSAITNLTACGISPILNTTLSNVTADKSFAPYRDFAYASIWSWAPPYQPSTDATNSLFRCAALNASVPSTSTTAGRWVVRDCSEAYPAACRADGLPYSWSISSSRTGYTASNDACPDFYSFAAPRTALENHYLLTAALHALPSISYRNTASNESMSSAGMSTETTVNEVEPGTLIWLNFNSLDVSNCWVSGVNSTCPYDDDGSLDLERTIVVPMTAAVIVIVLALLTLLIKCAGNRAASRRRRRGEGGWDYEGVPS